MTKEELMEKTKEELVDLCVELEEKNKRYTNWWMEEKNRADGFDDELNTYKSAVRYGLITINREVK